MYLNVIVNSKSLLVLNIELKIYVYKGMKFYNLNILFYNIIFRYKNIKINIIWYFVIYFLLFI